MPDVPTDQGAADLILAGARQPGQVALCDVEITGGIVSAVTPAGTRAGGRPRTAARVIDLDGRCVIPGLWDEHVHLTQWALAANRIDLSAARSAQEAAGTVRAALAGTREVGSPAVAVGVGFRDAIWNDAPTLELLDSVTGGRPTALISHDLHCVWLNTAAARHFNAHPGPDGLLREEPAFTVTRELGKLPDEVVDAWVRTAADEAAARGIVGVVDFEMTWNRDVWQRRFAAGFASLRVDAGVYAHDLDRAVGLDMRTGQVLPGAGGLLRVGPLKVLIDGSLNTRTAYCIEPYPHGGRGLLTVDQADLVDLLSRARDTGFVPAVHAIGDGANEVALNAFAAAGIRGRIEHAQFVRREDFARFGTLGLTASVQPLHALDDRDAAESNWAGRTDRAFPLRSLLEAGADLVLGSDAPVAPLDPWAAMSAATTRSRADGREPWHPEQAITRRQALRASTRGRTQIRAGDPADIAVLNADPLTAPDPVFAAPEVAATLVAGRFSHRVL